MKGARLDAADEKMLKEIYEKIVETEYTPDEYAEMAKKEFKKAFESSDEKYAYAVVNAFTCLELKEKKNIDFEYFKKTTEDWCNSEQMKRCDGLEGKDDIEKLEKEIHAEDLIYAGYYSGYIQAAEIYIKIGKRKKAIKAVLRAEKAINPVWEDSNELKYGQVKWMYNRLGLQEKADEVEKKMETAKNIS